MYRTYLATANDSDLDVGHEAQETKERGNSFIILILYSSRCSFFTLFSFTLHILCEYLLIHVVRHAAAAEPRPWGVWESLFLGLNYNMRVSR